MTAQRDEQVVIFADEEGRPTYAVPVDVLVAHQATPEQREAFSAALPDTEGFQLAPDTPIHLLTPADLEPYRLSAEQQAALLSDEGTAPTAKEVEGYAAYSPHDPRNEGFGSGGYVWTNYTYMDGSQGARWLNAWGAQSLQSNPSATYYPRLN